MGRRALLAQQDAKMDSKLKKFDTKWETGLAEMEARNGSRAASSVGGSVC